MTPGVDARNDSSRNPRGRQFQSISHPSTSSLLFAKKASYKREVTSLPKIKVTEED